MTTTTLLVIELLLCLIMIVILYKKYKIQGLYMYSIMALILSSIMSLKTINIYNYDTNLGVIPFITIFTTTNIIIQRKGPDEVKNLILTIISVFVISYSVLYLTSIMDSSKINLFTSASYDNILANSPRIVFADIVTVLYSLILNSKLYYYLKRIKNNILISNFFSTIIIHFIASILFGLIAYIFTKEMIDIVKIIMIRYLLSLIIGLLSTTVIYITKYIREK